MTHRLSDLFDYSPIQSKENRILEITKDKKPKNSASWLDKNTFIGLEVEVEQCAFPEPFSDLFNLLWMVDDDRSLREHGKEFRSIPIRGDRILFALEELEEYFNKVRKVHKKSFHFSERTSVHVHMNVRNLTTEQLCTVLLLYIVFEKLFFKFADKSGQKRWGSIFCVPIQESGDVLELYYAFANALSNNEIKRDTSEIFTRNWRKYTALNLLPIRELGTIEFRHLGGNLNIPYLLEWIGLIQALKLYSYQHPFKQVYDQVINLNTTSEYSFFLLSVMGNLGVLFGRGCSLQEEMEDGVTLIKDFGSFKNPNSPKGPGHFSLEEVEKSSFMKLFSFRNIKSLMELKLKGKSTAELMKIADLFNTHIGVYSKKYTSRDKVEYYAMDHIPELSDEDYNKVIKILKDVYGTVIHYPRTGKVEQEEQAVEVDFGFDPIVPEIPRPGTRPRNTLR